MQIFGQPDGCRHAKAQLYDEFVAVIENIAQPGWEKIVGIVPWQGFLFDRLMSRNCIGLGVWRVASGMEQITQRLAIRVAMGPLEQAGTHCDG